MISTSYAEVLVGLPEFHDRTRATELRAEALSIARELGMRPLIDRVLSSEPA